jgi:hypothetical protein
MISVGTVNTKSATLAVHSHTVPFVPMLISH